jgi:hypothetical protein
MVDVDTDRQFLQIMWSEGVVLSCHPAPPRRRF